MMFRLFTFFLKYYVNNMLDQWDLWSIKTRYGIVYIEISREPRADEMSYVPLDIESK